MVKDTLNMNTTEMELKAIAKAIGSSLKKSGHSVPHSTMLHAVSAALDKRDWHKVKASLEAMSLVVPVPRPAAKVVYSGSTMFLLRLAYALGRPVQPISADDALARAQAIAACGDLDGVLSWKGWNVPATFLMATSKLDAADFTPDAQATSGSFKVSLQAVSQDMLLEVGFTRADGWYLSSTGSARAYEQLEELISEELVLALPAPSSLPALSQPVKAQFWTDDRVFEVDFDASPYFMQASDKALAAILEVGFRGDYATDNVAEFMADNNLSEPLKEGFAYLHAVQKSQREDAPGFECAVDQEDYLRWMAANRPAVLAKLLCDHEGVSFMQAEEAEIAGEWNWITSHRESVSDASFDSLEEAQLNAYHKLNLLQEALEGRLL